MQVDNLRVKYTSDFEELRSMAREVIQGDFAAGADEREKIVVKEVESAADLKKIAMADATRRHTRRTDTQQRSESYRDGRGDWQVSGADRPGSRQTAGCSPVTGRAGTSA